MTLATEMKKLKESKAFYAMAGAGDLAVEKLREMPDRLTRLQRKADPKELPKVARSYANQVSSKAAEIFDDLAARGRNIVGRVNRQQATQDLEATAKATATQARQTVDSARRTAENAAKAVRAGSRKVGD